MKERERAPVPPCLVRSQEGCVRSGGPRSTWTTLETEPGRGDRPPVGCGCWESRGGAPEVSEEQCENSCIPTPRQGGQGAARPGGPAERGRVHAAMEIWTACEVGQHPRGEACQALLSQVWTRAGDRKEAHPVSASLAAAQRPNPSEVDRGTFGAPHTGVRAQLQNPCSAAPRPGPHLDTLTETVRCLTRPQLPPASGGHAVIELVLVGHLPASTAVLCLSTRP